MPPELFYLLCALLNVTPFALVFNGKLTLSLIFVLLYVLSLLIFKEYLFSLLLLSFSLYIDLMVVLGRTSWSENVERQDCILHRSWSIVWQPARDQGQIPSKVRFFHAESTTITFS